MRWTLLWRREAMIQQEQSARVLWSVWIEQNSPQCLAIHVAGLRTSYCCLKARLHLLSRVPQCLILFISVWASLLFL